MTSLKQRLDRGETAVILAAGRMYHHNTLQIVGLTGGFHGVWFDMEHVGLTTEQLEVATLACRASGLDSFCRVAPTDYATVSRCLEAGAGGIMAAQIFSAAQAEEFVKWAKFAPRGNRGLNVGGVDARFTTMPAAEYTKKANAETFTLIQIETLPAVEQCAEIAAACKQHKKHLAAVAFNPAHAQMLHDKGCRLISPTTDVRVVVAGLQAVKKDFAALFPAT